MTSQGRDTPRKTRLYLLSLVTILCIAIIPVAVTAAEESASTITDRKNTGYTVTVTQNKTTDTIAFTTQYHVPKNDTRVTIFVEQSVAVNTTVTNTTQDGRQRNIARYRPETGSDTVTITSTVNLSEQESPGLADHFKSGDNWALGSTPYIGIVEQHPRSETSTRTVHTPLERTTATKQQWTAPEGIYRTNVFYIGPHTTQTITTQDQTFTVLHPDAATPVNTPVEINQTLHHADRQYIPMENTNITIFVSPVGNATGFAYHQSAEIVVSEDRGIRDGRSTWIHEYVHTQQSLKTTTQTEWVVEGFAEYHAVTLHQPASKKGYSTAQTVLNNNPEDSGKLAAPDTWNSQTVPYTHGARAAALIDLAIRQETANQKTLADVTARLNTQSDPVTEQDLQTTINRVAGAELNSTVEEITQNKTTTELRTWDTEMNTVGNHQNKIQMSDPRLTPIYRVCGLHGVSDRVKIYQAPICAADIC